MKKDKVFNWQERGNSFLYAFEGIRSFFRQEHNALLHLAATFLVIILSFIFPVSGMEVIALAGVTCFVWAAELFNTAIEKMMDLFTKERHPSVKYIKDISAAAVLVAALAACLTGAIIFIPKIALLW